MHRPSWLFRALFGLACSGVCLAADPRPSVQVNLSVSNRPAQPDEWGYRPAEGSGPRLNPPSLTWVHEPAAATYTVQLSTDPGFAEPVTVERIPWPTYTHAAPLAPATYHWRYAFTTPDGRGSDWSRVRSFTVTPDAVAFPMPTRAQQRERVPKTHPRLFLRPEDLPRLRALARTFEADRFARLVAAADRILVAGPTPEPTQRGSARNKTDTEAVKYWWPNREQTLRACQEAETLAFVYLLSRDPKYGAAARRWILHLAAWDPDGPTNFGLNCEAAKPLLYRLPRAYDWAYDTLGSEERVRVQEAMRRRVKDAWESGEVGRGTGHLNRPFSSHGNRTWHKLGEAGIAFLGEVPEAETWLDYAVNKFFACYPVWSDDDGGWHEGVSYWGGYLSKAVWWLQVAQSALDLDGLRKPFFAEVGDFPLYAAPPGSPNMGFGDLSYRPPPAGWGGFLEYFLRAKGAQADGVRAGYWRWWTEQWKMKGEDGVLGFLYHANLPALPAARAPVDLPPSKVFHGIGVASLHTSLLDCADDVHLLFKSSPFGTQSHGHNPHSTFQLNAYGDTLLTTCVYRDLHGSRFHYEWAHSTRAHNGVLVNGEGQIRHTAAPHGRIVEAQLTPAWDHVVGDATAAYGGRLTRYRRHVLLLKADPGAPVVVLYDELEARAPATFQFLLHALAPFEVDESAARLKVAQPQAGLEARYLSPVPLAFRQWDGFTPPPDREFPNQWHVEAGTREPRTDLGMITVLVPHRSGQVRAWTAERTDDAGGVRVRLGVGNRRTTVAFPKAGAGPVRVVAD